MKRTQNPEEKRKKKKKKEKSKKKGKIEGNEKSFCQAPLGTLVVVRLFPRNRRRFRKPKVRHAQGGGQMGVANQRAGSGPWVA